MGSVISLAIGNFEIDWGKNSVYADHSELFQKDDVVELERRVYDDYNDEGDEPELHVYECLRKPLRDVVSRIELLGISEGSARAEFSELVELNGYLEDEAAVPIRFEDFAALLRAVDVSAVSDRYQKDFDLGEFFAEEIAPRIGLVGEPLVLLRYGEIFENLGTHTILWLLAQNPINLDLPVVWNFGGHLVEEWSKREDHIRSVTRSDQFLIVTEGSSDAYVIERAFQVRRSEIADFFYFVDTESGFPFTGTGNLHKFCQGLARIGLLNQTVVVYDNDAVGKDQWRKTVALENFPPNIKVIHLPDLPGSHMFTTIGPGGEGLGTINGKAAAIEAFLDLSGYGAESRIRWTTYVPSLETYQGEFEGKQKIVRDFLQRNSYDAYEFSKLDLVLNAIVEACRNIAQLTRLNMTLRTKGVYSA